MTYGEQNPENDGINTTRLEMTENGLSLIGKDMELHGDFMRMLPRLKTENLRGEFIVKATKIKGADHTLRIVDATAGLGEDSILLAASGYEVRMYEFDPVIAALLRDSMKRALETEELHDIVSRMTLYEEDSINAMRNLDYRPDVIVLDPMFPERRKSASVKKKFQLLQLLERPCMQENELLEAALAAKPRKIVIKRPLKGPVLAGIKPSYSIEGKAIRYDCILCG